MDRRVDQVAEGAEGHRAALRAGRRRRRAAEEKIEEEEGEVGEED
jgi:hypothetical protein